MDPPHCNKVERTLLYREGVLELVVAAGATQIVPAATQGAGMLRSGVGSGVLPCGRGKIRSQGTAKCACMYSLISGGPASTEHCVS